VSTGGTPDSAPLDPADKQAVSDYIRYAAAQRGIDPETAVRVADSEGLGTYVGDNNSSFGPFQLHYGGVAAGGNAVKGMGDTFTAQTGLDARDPSTIRQQIDFALDVAKKQGWNPGGTGGWHGATRVGIANWQGIGTFTGDASQFAPKGQQVTTASGATADQGAAVVNTTTPDGKRTQGGSIVPVENQRQFETEAGLSTADAYSACGPVAAAAFAATYGRNPTPQEAMALAKQTGWDSSRPNLPMWSSAVGMYGPSAEQALLKRMGVDTDLQHGIDWGRVQADVSSGNPVIISMSGHNEGHYLFIDGYDTNTGKYHGGNSSGSALAGGSDWITPERLMQMGWTPTDALFIASPVGSGPSTAASAGGAAGNEALGAGGEEGPTMTKQTASYKAQAETRNCRDCSMFRQPNDCTLVQGHIHPGGTCKHYESKVGAGQGLGDLFAPEGRALAADLPLLGGAAQGLSNAVQAINPATPLKAVPGIAQTVAQQAPHALQAATQAATQIPNAVNQAVQGATQTAQHAVQGAQHAVQGAQQAAQAVKEHPLESTIGKLPTEIPDVVTPIKKEAQAIQQHPVEETIGRLPSMPTPQWNPQGPVEQISEGNYHGMAPPVKQGDLGSLARATLLDPIAGELPGVGIIRSMAGIQDPFQGWREELSKGARDFYLGKQIGDVPVLGGVSQGIFDPSWPMMAFGPEGGPMNTVFDTAWGMDPVMSLTQRQVMSGLGKGFGLLKATQLGQVIGARLPAPGSMLATAAVRAIQALQLPGNVAASAAFQAATRGSTRGLNPDVLNLVGFHLSDGLPWFRTGRILEDLANATGSGAAMAHALQYQIQRDTLGRLNGEELRRAMLAFAPSNTVDGVLRTHGLDALTTPYLQAHNAVNSFAAKFLPEVARNSVNLPLGAVGGHALAAAWPDDPNDPQRDQKILTGSLVGMLVMGGNPYLSGYMSKDVMPAVMRNWRSANNPLANLKNDVAPILNAWTAGRDGIKFDQERLFSMIKDAWGGDSHAERVAKNIERTGDLPADLQSAIGRDALKMVTDANDEVLRRGATRGADATIKDPTLNPSHPASYKAKVYLRHAMKDEWVQAKKAASVGMTPEQLWSQQRGAPDVHGIGSRFNTISHMTRPREWANFEEGEEMKSEYEYSGLDRRTADQYANQKHAINNLDLSAKLDGVIQDFDRIPPGRNATEYSVLRIPQSSRRFVPQGYVPARSLGIGGILNHDDVYIDKSLETVLNRAFKEPGIESVPVVGPWLKHALELNSFGKEAVLGGSAFHMLNEVNQFLAANGMNNGLIPLAKIMMLSHVPRGFKTFVAANEPDIRQFVGQHGTFNMVPQMRQWSWTRALATGGATLGSYYTGYNAAKAVGKSDDEAHAVGAVSASLALGMNFPIGMLKAGGQREWTSIVTHFTDGLFHKTIPMMKLVTWQMHGRTPEAAQFVNDVFGGQNVQAMLRSRVLSDIMRLGVLAPDWTGGFVRQIGHAMFDSGSVGSMNRAFWTSAAMNSFMEVEGLNMALAHHGSWQNEPGHEGTVDLTPYFDQHGWNHKNPSTGEDEKVYWDVVPAWRGLLDPFRESARWGLAAVAQTDMGRNTLLNSPAVVGGMQPGQPMPPSARSVSDAWGKYASGRVGLIPGGIGDLFATTDFAGRPLNQQDDPWYERTMNALQRQAMRLTPAGIQTGVTAAERGSPVGIAAMTGATGFRLQTSTPYAEAQQKREKVIEEFTGKTEAQYQAAYTQYIGQKNSAYDQIDQIHAGINPKTGQPDPNLATPAQRLAEASKVHRPTLPEFEKSLMDPDMQKAHPDLLAQYQADLQQLDSIKGQSSGLDPADWDPQAANVNPDALYNEIWNRQPSDLANAKDDAAKARLRRQWLTDASMTHNIDHGDLEDFVKARLLGVDMAKNKLPGMTSNDLDLIVNAWQQAGQQSPDDAVTARQLQQQVVGQYAKAFSVDPKVLQERVHLRSIAPAEQTPATQQYNNAVATLEAAHDINSAPQYLQQDGTPDGGPDKWAAYNQALSSVDRWDKRSGQYVDKHLQILADERMRGAANAAKVAFNSPGYWDYERWFGLGKNMTDDQWSKFRAGTLDMWADKPTPQEAQNRNNLIGAYKEFNTPDPKRRGWTLAMSVKVPTVTFFGRTHTGMNLAAVVSDLNKLKSNAWKAAPTSLGLDSNITDAGAPPGADLSLLP
jgi:Peptidase_C39 like family